MGNDLVGFAAELVFADPDGLDPDQGEGEIAVVIALERVTGAVGLVGVEFNPKAEVRPVDVQLVADLVPTGGRTWQAGIDEPADEAPLELRARVDGRLVGRERVAQALGAWMAAVALNHGVNRIEVEEPEAFGALERAT